MPLLITPGQLRHRSELYHQLASLTAAGVGLIQGLEILTQSPPSRSFRRPLSRLVASLNGGETFSSALKALGNWLPEFDVALIEAGEKSGRLDACFRLLAGYYEQRAQMMSRVISDMAYPVFVVHFAVLIFPPELLRVLLFEANPMAFVWDKVRILGPLYAGVFALVYACQGRHGEWWRAWIERVVRLVPILGSARQQLSLARLSAALEGLITAGVSIVQAWELAAAASGSPALKKLVMSWRPFLESGLTPAELVTRSRAFPEMFSSLYHTGEISGQLDTTLKRLFNHYQEEGTRRLKELAQWTPRLLYIGILLIIGYQIVSFYSNYFNNMMSLTQ